MGDEIATDTRAFRILVTGLVVFAFVLVSAGVFVGSQSTPGQTSIGAQSAPEADTVPPVAVETWVADPGRLSASDWVIVRRLTPDLPAVEERPAGSSSNSGSGARWGGWFMHCPSGSVMLSPAPPCSFDEFGNPVYGEWRWHNF